MKGMKRREELLALMNQKGGLSVKELAGFFDVSKMTIHRDLEVLEQLGLIKKTFGGAVPRARETGPDAWGETANPGLYPSGHQATPSCLICLRPVLQHQIYCITLAGGERMFACCAHCGLCAHLTLKDKIQISMATDFITGRPHLSQNSFFLMNCSVSPCCQPSILTFDNREMAEKFQTGFGGVIGRMGEALDFLRSEMTPHEGGASCPHCSGG